MPEVVTGFDRIDFRRSRAEYGYFCGYGSAPSVEVFINGVKLTELWQPASVLALPAEEAGPDLAIWGPYPPTPGPVEEVPAGFVPVVTCGCGIFGCGGGYARITFRTDTVMWSDFLSTTRNRPVGIHTFTFDRPQYEFARLLAVDADK